MHDTLNSSVAKGSTLPRAVWLLSWISFFADVSSEMIYPLLPLFLIGVLGSSKTQLGMIEGAAVLIVALMSAVAGFGSDKMGKRLPWIRWGYGLPVIGKAVIALATAWQLVFAGRLLDRFGKGLRGAPRDALIANAVKEEQRGQAFGMHRAFDTAGALLGVLLSALLLWWLTGTPQKNSSSILETTAAQTPQWVYRSIFGIGAVLGLISQIITFFLRESESPINPDTLPKASKASNLSTLPRSYWSVLILLILFSLANSSDTFLLLRASDLGYAPWTVVLIYAVYNVTYSALSYPAGVLSDRLGRWGIIALGWTIYLFVYLGFAFLPTSQAWGIWPLMGIYGVYMALTDGVGKALIADHVPQDKRGTALGLFYAITGLTTLVASLFVGIVWDHFGSSAAFLISAGFSMLALSVLGCGYKKMNSKINV